MTRSPLEQIQDKIVLELSRLPLDKQLAFSASCSERAIDLYKEFAEKSGWGDFSVIRGAMDMIWSHLLEAPVADDRLQTTLVDIENNSPHSDDFDLNEVVLAQDALVCIYTTLRWCLEKKDSSATIVEFSFESLRAARYLVTTNGYWDFGSDPRAEEVDKVIIQEPVIQKEARLQKEDLALLQSQDDLSRDMIISLKHKAEQNRWTSAELFKGLAD
jgi:uncharacterized protein